MQEDLHWKGDLEVSLIGKIEEIDETVLPEINQRSGRGTRNEENPCSTTLKIIRRQFVSRQGIGNGIRKGIGMGMGIGKGKDIKMGISKTYPVHALWSLLFCDGDGGARRAQGIGLQRSKHCIVRSSRYPNSAAFVGSCTRACTVYEAATSGSF